MALSNPWITYLSRSYKSIKSSLINRLKTTVTEITDYSDSNILVIIISLFAGLIEQLNYYIDNTARELFVTTARRYSSLVKLGKLFDYRVKAKVSSTVDLRLTLIDGSDNPFPAPSDVLINAGIIVRDSSNHRFITQKKIVLPQGATFVIIPARQGVLVSNENLGVSNGASNQVFELDSNYRDGSLGITINSVSWELRDTLGFSGPLDNHFIVEVNENKQAILNFGDGVNGAIPQNGGIIYATYYESLGLQGNVASNTITLFDPSTKPSVPTGADDWEVTNDLPAVGGQDEQGVEAIRKNLPLSIRTLGRAVTHRDHIDLALLVPGVGKAAVEFNIQSKKITFYIAPQEGGSANSQLLQDVEDYFADKKMISTFVEAIPTGETKLKLGLTVTARFRRNVSDVANDIKTALSEAYGFNNSDINKSVRKSDIIALIDNLPRVDYLSLDYLTTIPYPRTLVGATSLEDKWLVRVNTASTSTKRWRLSIRDSAIARLFLIDTNGEVEQGNITIHATPQANPDFTTRLGEISLAIWGLFNDADSWVFTTYAYNEDHVIVDNTVPIYSEADLALSVNEGV